MMDGRMVNKYLDRKKYLIKKKKKIIQLCNIDNNGDING